MGVGLADFVELWIKWVDEVLVLGVHGGWIWGGWDLPIIMLGWEHDLYAWSSS